MEDPANLSPEERALLGLDSSGRGVQQAKVEPERPPCNHDSTRLDGWLDTHCMHCGAAGYWRNGELVAENSVDAIAKGHATKSHPAPKTLIARLSAEERAIGDSVKREAEHWREVGHPAPWENDAA